MESQDKEKEYERNIWETYRKEWATANREKRIELNKRMTYWQELMKSGLTASQAYIRVMEEPQETPLIYTFWTKMRKALVIIPVLALAAAITYGVVITGEIDSLKTELESVQSTLASTQSELSSTEQTLSSTQAELNLTEQIVTSTQAQLSSTEQTLTSVQGELMATEVELASTNSELVGTKDQLNSVQQDLTNLQATLSGAQQQLVITQETLEGLGITISMSKECSDVDLIDNPIATNPTWSQLTTFLSQDQTEKHTYIENVYDCSQFSRDVHNNAEAAGIRAAEVQVEFRNEPAGHALNAFLTSDYGLVYVDCTEELDTIAYVKAEKEYRATDPFRITKTNIRNDYWWDTLSSYYYVPSTTEGGAVTMSIKIYW